MPDGVSRQGRQLGRRFGSQASLLAVVCAVLVVCGVIAGLAGQLMTAGADRALAAATAQIDSAPGALGADVTTILVTTKDVDGTAPLTADALIPTIEDEALAAAKPYDADVSTWVFSPLKFIAGDSVRRTYLLDAQGAIDNATLVSGEWPTLTSAPGAIEVALPRTAAGEMGASVGDEFELADSSRPTAEDPPTIPVRVVGIFDPNRTAVWNFDLLRGNGFSPSLGQLPAYGPFVVAPGTLSARQMVTNRVATILNPDLAGDPTHVAAMARNINGLRERLTAELQPTVQYVIVRSQVGETAAAARANQHVTSALVMTVLLVVFVVGLAAMSLLARVLVYRRAVESTLLRDRGASRLQLGARAGFEAGLLAAVACVIAIPAVALLYRAAASWDALGAPWVSAPATPLVTAGLALATVVGVLLPASVLVIGATLPTARTRREQGGAAAIAARSGIDVALLALAVLGYVQLRNHHVSSGDIDPMLIIAPAVCLLAGAALVSRLLPLAAKLADAVASRARGLAAPLAGWHIARGGAMRGSFLGVAASMLVVFGLVYLATWTQSQHDQAAAAVGADLALDTPGGPTTGQDIAAVTSAVALPVTSRPIVLGTRPDGLPLVAIDANHAGDVLRGRLPGDVTWAQATAALKPATASGPFLVTGNSLSLDIAGEADAEGIFVTPTVVLTNAWGVMTAASGEDVPLDGASHTVMVPSGTPLEDGEWKVVAIALSVQRNTPQGEDPWSTNRANAEISIHVNDATGDGTWDAQGDSDFAELVPGEVTTTGTTVAARFSFVLWGVVQQPGALTLTSFPVGEPAPLLLSEGLADAAGLGVGDGIALTVDTVTVDAQVAGVVPYVPGQPHADAALMDTEALDRGLILGGHLEPLTDAWWTSPANSDTAADFEAAGLTPTVTIDVVTQALLDDPLAAPLKLAWVLAIAAALLLALVGVAAQSAAQSQQRAPTIARLRGIGVTRRIARSAHLAQHAIVTSAAILAGVALGAALAALLAPLLVVAIGGERPVPAAIPVWPTVLLAGAVVLLLVGSFLLGLPAARAVVRRSTVMALRSGELG